MDDANTRLGNWILTSRGGAYWPCDPRPEDIYIEDIAHALSMLCRFTGHTTKFYSVAEHSLLVSTMVPSAYALEGLLHDASEAYCADISKPLKAVLPDYTRIEQLNHLAIRTRFELPMEESPVVKEADIDILQNERAEVMAPQLHELAWKWGGTARPDIKIVGLLPSSAESAFLRRFRQLIAERKRAA